MKPVSPLDDLRTAGFAWARYKRLMGFMASFTTLTVIVSLGLLYRHIGMVSVHLYIAAALGIFAMMMLTAALMGLVFLSSGTGHDEAVLDPLDED